MSAIHQKVSICSKYQMLLNNHPQGISHNLKNYTHTTNTNNYIVCSDFYKLL